MRIPLRYGLLTAFGFIAWVLVTHSLISNPQSIVFRLTGPLSSILHFAMTYLGLKALEREKREPPRFKEALKTGVSIAFVYGLTASLFFVVALFGFRVDWLASEPMAETTPKSLLLVGAFAAMIVGAVLLGLLYSAVIGFFLARRRSEE
ncbi:MAG TPA: hypothetical protein VJP89_23350 [Pyrinomonadaceae bacterium]|nr:hypothetical protein [Pyrinomonadaceae bacterium]